jgi:hypothetical protein
MTKKEFANDFEKEALKMIKIVKAKNDDYAGLNANDPFYNFSQVELLGIASTEQGFLTRMLDKFCRIKNLIVENREGSVCDESIADTLTDLATYSIILKLYLLNKNKCIGTPVTFVNTIGKQGQGTTNV